MSEVNFCIPSKEKPDIRELTLVNGLSYPSDEELLMLILSKGTRSMPVEKMAHETLKVINTSSLVDIVERLKSISGVGEAKALSLGAALELGRRRFGCLRSVIKTPTDIVPYLKHIALEATERFLCVSMNGAHEILNIRVVSIGTAGRTLVHPREVLADPVKDHASGIICCHNHPFGPCLPSLADLETTKRLMRAATILGISFLDHLILTRDSFFSFLSNGLLDERAIDKRCGMEERDAKNEELE